MTDAKSCDTECTRSPCCKCRVCLIGKAALLLLLGGAIGYFVGEKCAMREMHAESAAVGALAGEQAGLIAVSGAKEARSMRSAWGTSQLTYVVAQQFPADKALKEISEKLRKDGWSMPKEDVLNPGMPNRGGWRTHGEDGNKEVRQWLGDWKDSGGNGVRYVLSYKYSAKPAIYKAQQVKSAEMGDLHVTAIYTPAAILRKQLEEIRKTKPAASLH